MTRARGPLRAAGVLFLVLAALPAAAGDTSRSAASQWLAAVNRQRLGASWHLAVELELSGDRGYRRELALDVRWAAWEHEAAALAVVTAPENLRGTAVLSRERTHPSPASRSWVFLNTRDPEVTEVAGASRYEGLLGSDFSHEDQQRLIDPTGWRLERLGDSPCGTARCVRLAASRRRPAPGPLVPDRAVWWIDPARKEVARAELYTQGRLLKVFEVTDWAGADGFWIPRRQVMRSPALGSRTTITLMSWRRVARFPDADFRPETLAAQARRAGEARPPAGRGQGRPAAGHVFSPGGV